MGQAKINYKDISTGDPLPGGYAWNPGQHGQIVNTTAPDLASETFLFWNPPGGPVTTEKSITVKFLPGSEATAWYGSGGPGEILTQAFSDGRDKPLTQTPIASVDPASAWGGGNSENVSNSTSVKITAKDSIAGDSGETFDGWLPFENGAVSGATLTVPAGKPCFAVAFYRNQKGTTPTTNRTGLAYTRVAVGVAVDGAGEPQPPEPWAGMAPAEQDLLMGLSVNEIASMINDTRDRSTIKKLGLELAQKALARLTAEEPAK